MILLTIVTLIILAAIFNAVMDVIDFRFLDSVFAWVKNEKLYKWLRSAHADKPKTGWQSWWIFSFTTDAWHFAKDSMVFCFMAAVNLAGFCAYFNWELLLAMPFLWMLVHEVFYNGVLILECKER